MKLPLKRIRGMKTISAHYFLGITGKHRPAIICIDTFLVSSEL